MKTLFSSVATTATTVTTTTTTRSMIQLAQPGDPIFGICNTTAGGDSTPSVISGTNPCNFYTGEIPSNAIDNNYLTKYTNFGSGTISTSSPTQGCNTGFYTTPSMGPSVLKAFVFITGNDNPNRDPTAITIEGSNSTTSLTIGTSWTLIYSGLCGLSSDPGRRMSGVQQRFTSNTVAYLSYRLLITTQRGSECSVQYSEAIFLG
ncbi:unnamed protein product [Didymodactylos carnosus]|uniref:Uncharacterized protein n=1 Tax=Didymodactylos carnosus TaxID=1234261 RepID=A0A815ZZI5_9BILA|nr:unnamed protein product [Didymodactylos carnosus]CAF1589152.1 unnamed protein product [Didymodactylos carnosus]CAF4346968.1 unnamed protein product [Didymodactylos carnosus]CAF4460457.1 unnamed protein product [Didymodactylos carnosus]